MSGTRNRQRETRAKADNGIIPENSGGNMKKTFVVGVTGASGVVYAKRLLDILCEKASVHLIVTETAREIAVYEKVSLDGYPATYHSEEEMGAVIASGSFPYDGMIIVPCSMKTLSAISMGYADNLITRAADVCLKEGRRCILVPREMPLSRIHLKNMLTAHDAGAVIMMASPGFYHHPATVGDLVDMVVARILDHLSVEHDLGNRWGGFDA
jgi:flavin prenyltransferase